MATSPLWAGRLYSVEFIPIIHVSLALQMHAGKNFLVRIPIFFVYQGILWEMFKIEFIIYFML